MLDKKVSVYRIQVSNKRQTHSLVTPLKISENLTLSNVFSGIVKGTQGWDNQREPGTKVSFLPSSGKVRKSQG